jgi:hypothetical protein
MVMTISTHFPYTQKFSINHPAFSLCAFAFINHRYLHVSNAGHLLRRPPHKSLSIGSFTELEALEVIEMAVTDPLDLGVLASCSPRLKLLHLSELW